MEPSSSPAEEDDFDLDAAMFEAPHTRKRKASSLVPSSPKRAKVERSVSPSPVREVKAPAVVESPYFAPRSKSRSRSRSAARNPNLDLPPAAAEGFQADIERDPQLANAVAGLERKIDLTNDKIDWKRLAVLDTKVGAAYARHKGWDEGTFTTPDWCASCALNAVSFDENTVFQQMSQFVINQYRSMKMEPFINALQQIYITKHLDDLTDNPECLSRWWSQRQIYEHLHDHNMQDAIWQEQMFRSTKLAQRELFSKRVEVDPLTGHEHSNTRILGEWRKFGKDANFWSKESAKAFAASDKRFF